MKRILEFFKIEKIGHRTSYSKYSQWMDGIRVQHKPSGQYAHIVGCGESTSHCGYTYESQDYEDDRKINVKWWNGKTSCEPIKEFIFPPA